jgi:hypothetical protein
MNPNLTCQYVWNDPNPGYVYWRGKCIEHLGPMGKYWTDWNDMSGNLVRTGLWLDWVQEAERKCLHLEQVGVEVHTGTFAMYYNWFKNANKRSDISWVEYLERNGEFYLRGENEIAFVRERFDADPDPNGWTIVFKVYIWNKETLQWTTFESVAECPDVVYNQMEKLGWDFGTRFWRGNNNHNEPPFNIIGQTYGEMCACYGWYKLPEENPVYRQKLPEGG